MNSTSILHVPTCTTYVPCLSTTDPITKLGIIALEGQMLVTVKPPEPPPTSPEPSSNPLSGPRIKLLLATIAPKEL
jgi:hypothetical protein